jgi:hypothetical protein
MRRRARAARFPLFALALGTLLPFVGPLREADALFRYFSRKNLAHALAAEPDKWVDTDVTVTDELCFVWPANPLLDTDQKSKANFVRFDTTYFRCAIDQGKKGDYLDACWDGAQKNCKDILDEITKVCDDARKRTISQDQAKTQLKELYWKLNERWKAHPIVTVFGKLSRADFFTPPYYLGKAEDDAKAAPEMITIVCERVEKPRERFYADLDD